MNYREAKQEAWLAAYRILVDSDLPVSSLSPEGFAESESSVDNFSRWQRAWGEVLEAIGTRGGIAFQKDPPGGGS